jgi:hypothetical protein
VYDSITDVACLEVVHAQIAARAVVAITHATPAGGLPAGSIKPGS